MTPTSLSLIKQAGPLIWPLLIISIIGFVLFFERLFFLHKGQIKAHTFLEGIKNLLKNNRLLEALTVCEETPGPVAIITKVALLNHDKPAQDRQSQMQSVALVELPHLERRLGTLGAIAKVAPLIGFLGTLVAVLQGFYYMQINGPYASITDFSGIVSNALVTTILGLALSAVAYLGHHFLHGRVRALIHDMEWTYNEIDGFISHEWPQTKTTNRTLGE